jgi:hypothetical protein
MTDNVDDIFYDVFDDPPEQWRVNCEDYSAARRALYAAKAQLG